MIEDVEGFKKDLRSFGCRISRPKTEWELMLFRHPEDGLQIIYQNKRGKQSLTKVTQKHLRDWESGREAGSANIYELMELMQKASKPQK